MGPSRSSIFNNKTRLTLDEKIDQMLFLVVVVGMIECSIDQTTWIQFQPNRTIEIVENPIEKNFYKNDRFEKGKPNEENFLKTIPIDDQRKTNESPKKSILKKRRIPSIHEKRDSSLRSFNWNSWENHQRIKLEETSISLHPNRLFQSNVNVFYPNSSSVVTEQRNSSSKLDFYVKPFRFDNDKCQINRRKERISWSPTTKEISSDLTKRRKPLEKKTLLLNSYHSLIRQNDLKDFSSLIFDDEEEKSSLIKPIPIRQDNQVIKYYRDLLDKMNKADQQLISSNENIQLEEKEEDEMSFVIDSSSNIPLTKRSKEKNLFFSPLILQMCFVFLILFNLLILYYYNDLSVWWNHYLLSSFPIDDEQ